jgi:methylmalonyl-CoA/ethylmalonyl-CoA epimerase
MRQDSLVQSQSRAVNQDAVDSADLSAGAAPNVSDYLGIDHVAIAVQELEHAIDFFREVLGFSLKCRRTTRGTKTGMVSAEMELNGIKFVLCQGIEPESQVSRLITEYGPGVAHIALRVNDVHSAAKTLKDRGMNFDTTVIGNETLRQIFSSRSSNTGLTFEFIERNGEEDFRDENVGDLFAQLERNDTY